MPAPTETRPGEFLSVAELAALLHRTPSSIYTERHRGEGVGALGIRVGRRLLWRRSDLDRWWDRQIEETAR